MLSSLSNVKVSFVLCESITSELSIEGVTLPRLSEADPPPPPPKNGRRKDVTKNKRSIIKQQELKKGINRSHDEPFRKTMNQTEGKILLDDMIAKIGRKLFFSDSPSRQIIYMPILSIVTQYKSKTSNNVHALLPISSGRFHFYFRYRF